MMQEQQYQQVKKLIYAKAHSFSRTTGYEVEELIAQGNLIYCQTLTKYNPAKAKFISLLYLSLTRGLIDYTKLLKKQMPTMNTIDMPDKITPTHAIQERQMVLKNNISKLSKEGKKTVSLILNDPSRLFGNRPLKPRQMYGAIRWHLRIVHQCSWSKTRQTLNELRELTYNN